MPPCRRMVPMEWLSCILVYAACFQVIPAYAWSVLVLGGTGFRGHLTSELLAKSGHNVTVLSRGNSYWGSLKRLREFGVVHWACNRTINASGGTNPDSEKSGLDLCKELTDSKTPTFDAVADFSSRNVAELRQAMRLLVGRAQFYIFISSHDVYDVSKNLTHNSPSLFENDAKRPGREVSPLERFQLKEKNKRGDELLECEEELMHQYNSGGIPFAVLRLANVFGPKENSIRFWLLHTWLRVHIALTLPMHLDETLSQTPISLTYTADIAQAVARVIEKARGDDCCTDHVEAEAFNLACEEAPYQNSFYDYVAEPMGLNYVETQSIPHNKSIVLYPQMVRGPLNIDKALEVLNWKPTDVRKGIRSVARYYDRVMLDETRYRTEREIMYAKCKKMLGDDGPRIVSWTRAYYDERRKKELYDEHDDEDEDDILLYRPGVSKKKRVKKKRNKGKHQEDL